MQKWDDEQFKQNRLPVTSPAPDFLWIPWKMRILFKSAMLSADRDLPVNSSLKGVSCFVSLVKLQFTSSWNEHEWKLFWLLQRVLVSEHVQSLHWGEKSVKMLEIVIDHIIVRATASLQCVSLVWWRTSSHVLSLLDIGWVVRKTALRWRFPTKKKLYQTWPKKNIFEDEKLFRGRRFRDIILDDVSFSLSNY